jgi:urea transport system ATP-binding protein
MAIILVEQYLDFAQELGDHLVVMDRGSIVYACDRATMDEGALKRALAI